MPKVYLVVRSVTQAMRGQEVLRQSGVTCHIERNRNMLKRYGCGYSLKVDQSEEQKALQNLQRYSIRVSATVAEGEV